MNRDGVLTARPGTVVVSHERMPVILEPSAYGQWLSTDITDTEDLTQLFVPFPPENMKAYPVDRRVNNPQSEGRAHEIYLLTFAKRTCNHPR